MATVAIAGAITAGTAGAAFAADSGSGSGTPAATAVRHPRLRIAVRRHAGKIVADTLGVTRADLRAALKSGKTVTQYATEVGGDAAVTNVKNALVTAADNAIDKAVTNNRISSDRGEQLKSKVPDRVDKAMNHVFGQGTGTQS
ncbi:MAG TPA: hypothetical protein VH986_04305 [Acidimicrobiia bacterium]